MRVYNHRIYILPRLLRIQNSRHTLTSHILRLANSVSRATVWEVDSSPFMFGTGGIQRMKMSLLMTSQPAMEEATRPSHFAHLVP